MGIARFTRPFVLTMVALLAVLPQYQAVFGQGGKVYGPNGGYQEGFNSVTWVPEPGMPSGGDDIAALISSVSGMAVQTLWALVDGEWRYRIPSENVGTLPELSSPTSLIVHLHPGSPQLSASLQVRTGTAAGPSVTQSPPINVALSVRERGLWEAMNKERSKHGFKQLSLDFALTEAARVRSRDMVAGNYFAHFGPRGQSAFTVLRNMGANNNLIGENLAKAWGDSVSSVQGSFDALMVSESHRANILDPRFSRVGVGVESVEGSFSIFTSIFGD